LVDSCVSLTGLIFILNKRILIQQPGYPDADGRIILRWIYKKWDGGMDWFELAQDRKK
jgi:hypothetical protein